MWLLKIERVKTEASHMLEMAIKNLTDSKKVGKVGWVHASQYIDSREYVAAVAAQNEFGNPNKHIPARPFMRPTIAQQQKAWARIAELGAKQILLGNQTPNDVLEILGLKASGDIKRTISRIYEPVLSRRTIEARIERSSGRSRLNKTQALSLTKPLIDTGIMFNTLTNVVEDE